MKLKTAELDLKTHQERLENLKRARLYKERASRKFEWPVFVMVLILNDLLMATFAFRAAYWIRFSLNVPIFNTVFPSSLQYSIFLLVLVPVWMIVFSMSGLYSRKNLLSGTREYSLLFTAITFGIFIFLSIGFFSDNQIFARGWLVLTWALAFVLVGIGRFILRRLILIFRDFGYFVSPTLIVGATQEGRLLAEQLSNWKYSGLFIVGFIDESIKTGQKIIKHLSVIGTLDDLDRMIQKYHIEEIIFSGSALTREQMLAVYSQYGPSDKVHLRMSSGLYEIITTGLQVKEFACVPLLEVNKVRLTGIDQVTKHLLDYALTIFGLIMLMPIFLLISIAIKLDSPGPVFYRRRVMGVNNHQFDALKFRTMAINGDEILEAHPELKRELAKNHKLKNDPRVTGVGKWIRKFSLDEFPQLVNVLFNQMSLVGPRMISPEELNEFKQWGMNLLTVKPGITGLWQVSGRSDVSYEERVRLDMHYIRNWSIWLDLQLLLRTIPAVLSKRGAY